MGCESPSSGQDSSKRRDTMAEVLLLILPGERQRQIAAIVDACNACARFDADCFQEGMDALPETLACALFALGRTPAVGMPELGTTTAPARGNTPQTGSGQPNPSRTSALTVQLPPASDNHHRIAPGTDFLRAQAVVPSPSQPLRRPDVIFVPSPDEAADEMLALAEVTRNDLVYDLGCGDGRIVIAAAQRHGCLAVGFDIDPQRVAEARQKVTRSNVGHLV